MRVLRKVLIQGAIILAIAAALYVFIDKTYGLFYPPRPYDNYSERLTSPSYVKEPYFSESFLAESFTQPGGWLTPENTRLVWPKQFHGKYFNIDQDTRTSATYRRTINTSAQSEDTITILLLGGSALYGSEVPDEYTIASQLSKILNQKHEQRYYIINAGVTSVNTSQELERLQYELQHGLRPHIVLSYNGVNDVYQGIYTNNPDGVIFSAAQKKAAEHPTNNHIFPRIKNVIPLNIYSALQARAVRENSRIAPKHMEDAAAIASVGKRTRDKYVQNVLAMQRLSREFHFIFFSMLQPTVFAVGAKTNNQDDVDIGFAQELARKQTPKLEVAFEVGYPLLKEAIKALRKQGIHAYDLSEILNSKREPIYFDFCHINSHGNEIIATAMEVILKSVEF